MALREKIILGLMALVIVYGLVAFVTEQAPKDEGLSAEGLSSISNIQDLVTSITSNLNLQAATVEELEVLKVAGNPWQDSFVDQPVDYEEASSKSWTEKEGELHYVGYLASGRGVVAIINGRDYRVREAVEGSDYVVQSIHSSEIILEDRRGVTITLLMEDESLLSHEGYRHEE